MNVRRTYFPTLDGWRALSVIGVILYHGRFGFFDDESKLLKIAAHGDVGVSAFFAISGFLITSLLFSELKDTGRLNLRRFYLRRVFRILPPYYAVLGIFCLLAAAGAIHIGRFEVQSCLLFYRNYMPLGMDQQGGFYTAHFWSLAVEEHFYLIWPLLLMAMKPKRAGRATLLFALAVAVWRLSQTHIPFLASILPPEGIIARTDTRIDGLLWGCLAAIYFPDIQRVVARIRFQQLWIPILVALAGVEAFHVPQILFFRAVLLAALVVSTVVQPESWLGRVLESMPLRWIGGLSYSLYLWQELFLPEVHSELASGPLRLVQHAPWNLVVMLACACVSRYLLEKPMTELGRRLTRDTRPAAVEPEKLLRWPVTVTQTRAS